MKKLFLCLIVACALSAVPALAASKTAAPAAKPAWQPLPPDGYTSITWAKAPGIASFFKAPDDSGAIDFVTRIYLPQNQINFILSTSAPIVLDPAVRVTVSDSEVSASSPTPKANVKSADIGDYPNMSFPRFGAEATKALTPSVKFLWDAPFFNMKPQYSDLSMATKYLAKTTTVISRGSRSIPDMAQPRRMLIVDNKTGKAIIGDFDSAIFTDSKSGDLALEGFSPAVAKSDSAGGAASRLFLGVSKRR